MKKTVLIVEDEKRINDTIANYFVNDGFDVVSAYNGIEALELFNSKSIDIIILDVMLPMLDGWTLCRKFREESDVLIVMLTALEDENDKLMGFELGVDEYVTKPFSPKVLVARAKALLNRFENRPHDDKLEKGGIFLDTNSHKVIVENEEVETTPKEYLLLEYFIDNIGRVLSREQILNHIWGYDYFGDTRVVDTHIKNLRKKLGEKGKSIKTIKSVGYRFEGE